nr:MAG TPA: PLAC8 family [Siphoviridae sp. ctX8T1]
MRFTTHAFFCFNNKRALHGEHGIKGSPCLLSTYTYCMMPCSF